MKKNKTKSILACAVLASVLGVGVWLPNSAEANTTTYRYYWNGSGWTTGSGYDIPSSVIPTGAKVETLPSPSGSDPSGSDIIYDIYVGCSSSGDVTGNITTITSNKEYTISLYLHGGYSYSGGDAKNNSVTIGESILDEVNFIYGGFSFDGAATNNTVTFNGTTCKSRNYFYGGYSSTGAVTGNTVTISGGTSTSPTFSGTIYIYGGRSDGSGIVGGDTADKGNKVTISDGTFVSTANIYGGYNSSGSGDVTGNKVTISGGTFSGTINIYGGFFNSGSVKNNIVTINGGTFTGTTNIYGGNKSGTGNTLNLSMNLGANTVDNFQKFVFTLPTGSSTILTVANTVSIDGVAVDVYLNGYTGENTITLINNVGTGTLGTTNVYTGTEGTNKYEIALVKIDDSTNKLVLQLATEPWYSIGDTVVKYMKTDGVHTIGATGDPAVNGDVTIFRGTNANATVTPAIALNQYGSINVGTHKLTIALTTGTKEMTVVGDLTAKSVVISEGNILIMPVAGKKLTATSGVDNKGVLTIGADYLLSAVNNGTTGTTGTVNLGAGTLTTGKTITGGTLNIKGNVTANAGDIAGGINAIAKDMKLTLNGGTLGGNLSGNGSVVVDGDVNSAKTIANGVTINSGKTLTNTGTISGVVTNKGTFDVTAGSVTGNIANSSTLNVSGGSVKLVTNTGTMNVTDVSALIDDINNANGIVNFDEADATLTNGMTVTGGTINVKKNLTATVTDLASVSGINNKATLTLTGTGDIKDNINNLDSITGTTVINGTITSAKTIANVITINASKKLTNTGTISGAVTNNGTFDVTAGSVTGAVTNNLTMNVTGGTVEGGITNAANCTVTVSGGEVKTGAVTNNGTFAISGGTISSAVANNKVVNFSSGTLTGVITGVSGSNLNVTGDVTTQASKIQGTTTLTITNGKVLTLNGGTSTSAYDTLVSTITLGTTGTLKNTGFLAAQTNLNCALDNDGTLKVTADRIKADIDNAGGTVNLEAGTLADGSTITGGTLNINDDVTMANAGDIAGGTNVIAENKKLTLNSGDLGGNLSGDGSVVVDGTVSSAKTITNAVTINGEKSLTNTGTISGAVTNGGTFTTTANGITGGVTNNSSLELTGGDLGSNITDEATPTGTTTVSGTVTNTGNKTITQNGLIVTGSLSTDVDKLVIANGITNNWNLTLTGDGADGDTLQEAVSGTGTTVFGDGNTNMTITANSSVATAMTVKDKTTLVICADNVNGAVANSGTVKLNGTEATLENEISGTGNVIVDGTVKSALGKLTNTGNLTVNEGKVLELTEGTLARNIAGAGTVKLGGNISVLTNQSIAGTLDGNSQTLTMTGGASSVINTLTVGTLTGATNLALDVDMSNFTSDKLAVGTITGATVNVSSINIVKDITADFLAGTKEENKSGLPFTKDSAITFVSNKDGGVVTSGGTYKVNNDAAGQIVLTNNYKYTFEKGTTDGTLKYKVETTDLTFKKFMEGTLEGYDSDPATLSLTADMANTGEGSTAIVVGDNQSNNAINVNLNGHKLTSANESVITINSGKTVNLNGGSDSEGTVDANTDFSVAGILAVDGKINLAGDITNTGAVTFAGTTEATGTLGGAGSYTNTGTMTIEDAAKLQMTGANGLANSGILNLGKTENAVLGANITGAGTVNIMGEVTSAKTIENNVVLEEGKKLTNSGTISGAVTNNGTLNNTGTVSGALTNGGTFITTANGITGGVKNTATLELTGGDLGCNITDETTPTGTTTVSGIVTNNGNNGITQKNLIISGSLTTDVDALHIGTSDAGPITNNGILTLTGDNSDGDTLQEAVSGTGTTVFGNGNDTMTITANSSVATAMTVKDKTTLVIGADNVDGAVANNGTVNLGAGTLGNNTITGGSIVIKGAVTANADNLDSTNGITNDVADQVLTLTGGTVQDNISGAGTVSIDGTVTSAKNIANKVVIAATSGDFTVTGGTISGALENNGTFAITDGSVTGGISNTDSGTLNVSGGTISTGPVTNAGTFNVTGGTVSSAVTNDLTMNVSGGEVTGVITNNADGTLTISGTGKVHKVTNTGTMEVNYVAGLLDDITNTNGTVNLNAEGTLATGSTITGGTLNVKANITADAGDIAGGTNVVDSGKTLNLISGTLAGTVSGTGNFNVVAGKTVTADADKIQTTGTNTVAGTLNLVGATGTGKTLSQALTGTGKTIIHGGSSGSVYTVNVNADISTTGGGSTNIGIEVESYNKLVISGNNLKANAQVDANGELELKGGTITGYSINGTDTTGTLTLTGGAKMVIGTDATEPAGVSSISMGTVNVGTDSGNRSSLYVATGISEDNVKIGSLVVGDKGDVTIDSNLLMEISYDQDGKLIMGDKITSNIGNISAIDNGIIKFVLDKGSSYTLTDLKKARKQWFGDNKIDIPYLEFAGEEIKIIFEEDLLSSGAQNVVVNVPVTEGTDTLTATIEGKQLKLADNELIQHGVPVDTANNNYVLVLDNVSTSLNNAFREVTDIELKDSEVIGAKGIKVHENENKAVNIAMEGNSKMSLIGADGLVLGMAPDRVELVEQKTDLKFVPGTDAGGNPTLPQLILSGNSKVVLDSVQGNGRIFVDPSYLQVNEVNADVSGTLVSQIDAATDGSVVNIGNVKDSITTAYTIDKLESMILYDDLGLDITADDLDKTEEKICLKNTVADKKLGLLALKGYVKMGNTGRLAVASETDMAGITNEQIYLKGEGAVLAVDSSIAFNDADCVDDAEIFKANNVNYVPNVAVTGVNGSDVVKIDKDNAKLFLTGIEEKGVGIYAIMQGTGIDGTQYFDVENDMVMQDGGDTYRIVELDEQEQADLNAYLTGGAENQKIYAVRVDWNKVEKIFTAGPINGQEAWNNMLQNDDKHTPGKEWLLKVIKGTKQDREVGRSALNQVASLAQDLGVERGAYDVTNMVGSAIDKHWDDNRVQDSGVRIQEKRKVWASYIRNKDEIDSLKINGMDAQYTAQYNGAVVGVDITKNFGVALAYADGNTHNNFGGRNEAEYYGGSMYFHKQVGNLAVGFDATYLYGNNELSQNIFGTEMNGKAKTDTISGGLTAKYLAKAGKFGDVGFFTGARYMHINSRKFSDNLGISHEAEKINSVVVPVGLEYNGAFKMKGSDWTWKPRLAAGYLFNLGDRDNYMVMNYRGVADSFLYDFVDKGAFFANAGMTFEKGNFSLGLGYDFMKSKNSKNRRWNVSMNVAF